MKMPYKLFFITHSYLEAPIWCSSGVVTIQDSQSGKSFSSILNLAKNVLKSPIKCLKEQNIHRKQSVYAYLIVNI